MRFRCAAPHPALPLKGGGMFVACSNPSPHEGRAIAYGNSRVESAAWPHAAFGYRYPVSESAREPTRIETRTAIASLRCMRLETAPCARAFVHMRFPCHEGEGRVGGVVRAENPAV